MPPVFANQACPIQKHRAAHADGSFQNWPLLGVCADLGLEMRRCPTCGSTSSRALGASA